VQEAGTHAFLNADINNEVGTGKNYAAEAKISAEECSELCDLLAALSTKSAEHDNNVPALKETMMDESACTVDELKNMVKHWVCIEDDPDVIEEEVEEAIEEHESAKKAAETTATAEEEQANNANDTGGEDDDEEEVCDVSWDTVLESVENVRNYLRHKKLVSASFAFDGVVRQMRNERLSHQSAQLSINSFFSAKKKQD